MRDSVPIKTIRAGILDETNGVPTYVATNGDTVWKDDYPSCSMDAAFFGEDKYDDAIELDAEPDGVDWYELEIMGDGGTYRARYADDAGAGQMGDMPGEAASYLEFTDDETFPPETTAATLDQQLIEILDAAGGICDPEYIAWLVNSDALDEDAPDFETIIETLDALVADDTTPIEAEHHDYYSTNVVTR